jgi:acyl-CoA thioester hydrolase
VTIRLLAERTLLHAYPFICELQTRLADIDHAQHVNNAVIAAYHEEARARMHIQLMGIGTVAHGNRVDGGIIAHVSIHYLREVFYGSVITGCVALAEFGRTSYTLAQALFQEATCVGACDTVVAYREQDHAIPLSATLRSRLYEIRLRTAKPD